MYPDRISFSEVFELQMVSWGGDMTSDPSGAFRFCTSISWPVTKSVLNVLFGQEVTFMRLVTLFIRQLIYLKIY